MLLLQSSPALEDNKGSTQNFKHKGAWSTNNSGLWLIVQCCGSLVLMYLSQGMLKAAKNIQKEIDERLKKALRVKYSIFAELFKCIFSHRVTTTGSSSQATHWALELLPFWRCCTGKNSTISTATLSPLLGHCSPCLLWSILNLS